MPLPGDVSGAGHVVKPRPVPKPATSTHTGNNPRGVAIAPAARPVAMPVRRPTPHQVAAIHGGLAAVAGATKHGTTQIAKHTVPKATPKQQVALAQATRVGHALAHLDALAPTAPSEVHISPTHLGSSIGGHGGLGPIAAVVSHPNVPLATLLKPAGGVLGRLGQDTLDFPKSTIQGSVALGGALAHDVIHPMHAQLPGLLGEMYQQDALAQALTGHFGRAGHLASQHPLGAVLDVAGGAGAAGRLAGAAGRAAKLDVASLEPRATELGPDIAPIYHRASPNLFTSLAQQGILKAIPHISPRLEHAVFDREMRMRANEHQMIQQDVGARAEANARQQGGAGATPKAITKAKKQATGAAWLDTMRANALRHPHTGDIFYKSTHKPAAVKAAEARGYEYERVRVGNTEQRTRSGAPAEPRYIYIPKALHDQMAHHATLDKLQNHLVARGARQYQRQFRNSVLPFSTKWITGNIAEAALRTGLEGANPIPLGILNPHIKLSARVIDTMRREGLGQLADRLEAQALQGTHYSLNVRLDRELRALERRGKTLPTRAALGTAHKYNQGIDWIFRQNAKAEQRFAQAVLGKHMAGTLKRLKSAHPDLTPEELMARVAHHYARPEVSAEVGRYSRRVLGQYSGFGPAGRALVRNVAPFGPWYVNAGRFMGTLPFRHPLAAGAVWHAARTNDAQWDATHKSIKGLGGDLLAMPSFAANHFTDIGRYTPAGAFSAGTGLPFGRAALADVLPILAPQWATLFKNAIGLDAFNEPLQWPGPGGLTPTGRVSTARSHRASVGEGNLPTLVSNFVAGIGGPSNAIHRVLVDRGRTPYNTEKLWDLNPTTKTGSNKLSIADIIAGLNKVFNPLRATVVNPHPGKSSRSGGLGTNSLGSSSLGGSSLGSSGGP